MKFARHKRRKRPKPTPVTTVSPGTPRRRNEKNRLPFLLAVIMLLLFFGILIVLFKSPLFAIRSVDVQNTGASDQLVADIKAFKGKNLLLFNPTYEQKTLAKKYPQTQQISIVKHYPNALMVTLNERLPVALLRFALRDPNATETATTSAKTTIAQPAFLIDKTANLFQSVNDVGLTSTTSAQATDPTLAQFPLLTYEATQAAKLGTTLDNPNVFATLALIAAQKSAAQPITAYTITDYGLSAKLPTDPITVFFAPTTDAQSQLQALQMILGSTKIERKRLVKIDLRYDKPTVTYR